MAKRQVLAHGHTQNGWLQPQLVETNGGCSIFVIKHLCLICELVKRKIIRSMDETK
jgi:hypothetical protein